MAKGVKTGGRRPGTPNKRTIEFMSTLESLEFNPAKALIWAFNEAKAQYIEYNERFQSGRISPMEDNAPKYLGIAAGIAKEIASYSYPKLKSIDQQKTSPLDGMTPEQKLEAMKHAVSVLEIEVKKSSGS